ncbi:MAG: hypothetical protein ACM3U1_06370 [Chloroflexota bacterium]
MNKEKELIYRKRMKIGTILAGLLAITHKNIAQSSEYKRPGHSERSEEESKGTFE